MIDITEDIIVKVLEDQATKEEARAVAHWFATADGQLFLSRRISDEAGTEEVMKRAEEDGLDIPTQRMKERFMQHVEYDTRRSRRWLWIAAVAIPFIFMVASLGFLIDRTGALSPTEYAELDVPYGEQMRVILQDGSIVHLNSGTKFRYPKRFGLLERKVNLNGEAYFEISKDRSKPFRVNLNGVFVEVTGTKFNVKAYGRDQHVDVCLDEGSVALKKNDKFSVALKPNEYITYDRVSGRYAVGTIENTSAVTAWRTSSLNFYKTPLKDVLNTLTRQYGVNFTEVGNEVQNVRFTLSTSKVQIEDILKDLEYVSSISFVRQGEDRYKVVSK